MNDDSDSEKETLINRLKTIELKKEKLTDKFVEDLIGKPIYEKLKTNIDAEVIEIKENIRLSKDKISNLDKFIETTVQICLNTNKYWDYGSYEVKILIQDLVFPEGVVLDTKNRQYLGSGTKVGSKLK